MSARGLAIASAGLLAGMMITLFVMFLDASVIQQFAVLCSAKPGQTFNVDDLMIYARMFAVLLGPIVMFSSALYGFIDVFRPGRSDTPMGRY